LKDITVYLDIFGKNEKDIKMLFKESGNIETVCSFTYATPEWKFMYI
jgi:hypothetical protein